MTQNPLFASFFIIQISKSGVSFAVLLFKEVWDLELFACLCSAHRLKLNIFVQFAALMSNISVKR